MKVGVFDSGIGGLSVARSIERAFPSADVIYVHDAEHMPYGTKTVEEIYNCALPKIKQLYESSCDIIVLACNTVTMTNQARFEAEFDVPFVGLRPMVKPAAKTTKSKKIIVCATPATLASGRYQSIKQDYANGVHAYEPDCADWAMLIEANIITEERIRQSIEPGIAAGADVIVLACTHYHWIEQHIRRLAGPNITVLQPEMAVIETIRSFYKPNTTD